ncbi:MAG TPA: transglutaminaseTgpA domain-containing protein, partial [Chloroflexaceae bacterium]|nr:transglutaminaseTgpA domain-containing protein [Chloroflexaceae bacterium]
MATTTIQRNQPSISRELGEVLPGALLILLMTGAVVWALSVSTWAPGLGVLRPMALLGLLVGAIFARLPWLPGWLAHLLSGALAVTWAVQLLGDQMDPALLTWRDQAADLALRVVNWSRVIGSGGRGEDILLFVVVLCLLVWALAYGTAWMVLRRGWTWRPIVLNALVALVNYTYVLPKPTLAFFVFLCAALLLLVYQHVLERQAQWDAQQVEYPDLLPVRFLWSAALVCGILIALTAALPGQVSIDRATRTWELLSSPFKAAREGWEDMFSTISAPPGAGSGAFTTGTAPLGGARQLSDEVVMEVRSVEYDYWRALALDKYTGNGWQNTVGEQARATLGAGTREQARTPLAADEPMPLGDVQARRAVEQRFSLAGDRLDDLVMVGGSALSVSLPTLVEHNYEVAEGGRAPNFDETALIVAEQRLREGQTYTVTALMSFADVAGLRAAGDEYPQWVRERYLQLPETVTARTRERAAQVIADAGARTPYDAAIAIEQYLRTFAYNEAIPAPPANVDHVDWFLFERREGYCDYFASAMVVMLRSQGIPARWVRGYAGGEFDAERGVYVVRENVAHSWPEVYFPGYGWERFEPTAASYTSVPVRPLTSQLGQDPSVEIPIPPGFDDPGRFEDLDPGLEQTPAPVTLQDGRSGGLDLGRPLAILGALLGALALAAVAVYGRWRYELRGLSQAGASYAGMALLAGWGGMRQDDHQTPQEYAAALGRALPEHRPTIERIARAYAREQYGGPSASPARLYASARGEHP